MASQQDATDRAVREMTRPGPDRDAAVSMFAQARRARDGFPNGFPIDTTQLEHMLRIGHSAGLDAGLTAARQDTAAGLDALCGALARSEEKRARLWWAVLSAWVVAIVFAGARVLSRLHWELPADIASVAGAVPIGVACWQMLRVVRR